MGPSGSGKSTLLNCLGALDRPTSGEIYIDGISISSLDDEGLAWLRSRKIGFIFQSFNLIPVLTALDNVMIPMIFKGLPLEERKRRGKDVLSRVGLEGRYDHKPNELSGGQQQRVAIARALANDPIIVFADEPTGNLDSKTGKEIMNIFKKLNKDNKTIVVITHDPLIAKQTNRMIKIQDGSLIK